MSSTNFFAGIQGQDAIKKHFYKLVKQHHPDAGGCHETMVEINSQYQDAMRGIYREERDSESVEWWMEQEGLLFDKVVEFLRIPGLEVELMGVWLWITGETKPNKEKIKELGGRWAKDKKAWYWRSPEHSYRRKNKPSKDLDGLREQWGGRKAKSQGVKALPIH